MMSIGRSRLPSPHRWGSPCELDGTVKMCEEAHRAPPCGRTKHAKLIQHGPPHEPLPRGHHMGPWTLTSRVSDPTCEPIRCHVSNKYRGTSTPNGGTVVHPHLPGSSPSLDCAQKRPNEASTLARLKPAMPQAATLPKARSAIPIVLRGPRVKIRLNDGSLKFGQRSARPPHQTEVP